MDGGYAVDRWIKRWERTCGMDHVMLTEAGHASVDGEVRW